MVASSMLLPVSAVSAAASVPTGLFTTGQGHEHEGDKVTPKNPQISQASCTDGSLKAPSLSLPSDTSEVHYTKSGAVVAGGTTTVTASAQSPKKFPDSVSGWNVSSDNKTATMVIKWTTVDCSIAPTSPTVTQAQCQAGKLTGPSVTLPADTSKIKYTKSGSVVAGGTVTVTAKAQGNYEFQATSGWQLSSNDTVAKMTISLDKAPDCSVTPVAPTVTQSVCLAGEASTPTVSLPGDTSSIDYSKSGSVVAGGTVTVKAETKGDYKFPETVSGWTISDGRTKATRTIHLDSAPDCSASLTPPTVTQSVCLAGEATTPTVSLPNDTSKVHYTLSGTVAAGNTVTVTATAQGEYRFAASVAGWEIFDHGAKAKQTIVLYQSPQCSVTPLPPTVTQAECHAGVATSPSVTLPGNTSSVHYSKTGAVTPGGTVTVTATAQGALRFPSSVSGWTMSSDHTLATYLVILSASPDCVAVPLSPVVTQSTCVAGQASDPSVILPDNTSRVTYTKSSTATAGGSVIVTAKAVGELRFGSPAGWTISDGGKTATRTITLDGAPNCTITPEMPTVAQSVCVAGTPSTPSVTLPANTSKVTYTKTGAETAGGSVTVTATAINNFGFPSSVSGWTVSPNHLTATRVVTLNAAPDCVAVPTAPTVTQSVCRAGNATTPSVTLSPDTARVVYTKTGTEVADGTVTVTATAQGEYRFLSGLEGWTVSENHSTATMTIQLTDAPNCIAEIWQPTVNQSVCRAGEATTPQVILPEDSEQVTYTESGSETAGGTVTVTATVHGELRFPSNVEFWTISEDRTTATQDFTLNAAPDCVALPVVPTVVQSTCFAGKASTPSVTLPEDTDRVTYIKGIPPVLDRPEVAFDTAQLTTIDTTSETAGGTVTVTAVAQGEYRFPSTVEGWTISEDRTMATQVITLNEAPDCGAAPVMPTVTQSKCQPGGSTTPLVTLPTDTERIVYTKSGTEKAGTTETITATAQGEYRFAATVAGWTVSTDGLTATALVTLTKPSCGSGSKPGGGDKDHDKPTKKPTAKPSPVSDDTLAETGSAVPPLPLIGGAFVILLAGGALLVVRRRWDSGNRH